MRRMAEQNRGVVLETQPGAITVLTPQGEFNNIPWSQLPYPQVGAEVTFALPMERKSIFRHNRVMAIAACLLIMFFSVTIWTGIFLPSRQQVVAYVNVDINPSIELGLNKQGKVVQAIGLNRDGELLLQKLKLISLAADQAVESITNAAMAGNYLQAGKENNILITVSNSEKVQENVKKLEQKVTAQLTANNLNGNTQVIEVSGDLHDRAKELGVSPGKYIVLLEAVDEGLDLSLEDMKGNSVIKAIKMAGGTPGQIISKAQNDKKDYKDLEKRTEDKLKKIEEARKNSGNKLPPGQDNNKNNNSRSDAGDNNSRDNNSDTDKDDNDRNNGRDKKAADKSVSNIDISSSGKDVQPLSQGDIKQDNKGQDTLTKEENDQQGQEKVEKKSTNELKKDRKKTSWSDRIWRMWSNKYASF